MKERCFYVLLKLVQLQNGRHVYVTIAVCKCEENEVVYQHRLVFWNT